MTSVLRIMARLRFVLWFLHSFGGGSRTNWHIVLSMSLAFLAGSTMVQDSPGWQNAGRILPGTTANPDHLHVGVPHDPVLGQQSWYFLYAPLPKRHQSATRWLAGRIPKESNATILNKEKSVSNEGSWMNCNSNALSFMKCHTDVKSWMKCHTDGINNKWNLTDSRPMVIRLHLKNTLCVIVF